MLKKIKTFIDWSKVKDRANALSNYSTAKTKHFLQTTNNLKIKAQETANLSMTEARKAFKEKGFDVLRPNVVVTQATKHVRQLLEGSAAGRKALQVSQHKWFKKSMVGVGVTLGVMMAEKIANSFTAEPAIPASDKHGYDVMTETMTDFGSPIKLLKTASKTITPYYSSVRKGLVTTTSTITDQNMALFLNKKAIGHTRY